jgi:hypothetical protein
LKVFAYFVIVSPLSLYINLRHYNIILCTEEK